MEHRSPHPVALLVDELLRLTPRLRGVFADAAASADLSRIDIMVLSATVDARTPPTVPQIGRSLGHARQVIQRSANVLVAKGFIEATANPDHKRAPLLVPTEAGRQAKAQVDGRAKASLDALLAILKPERCRELVDELRDVRGRIEVYLKDQEGTNLD